MKEELDERKRSRDRGRQARRPDENGNIVLSTQSPNLGFLRLSEAETVS